MLKSICRFQRNLTFERISHSLGSKSLRNETHAYFSASSLGAQSQPSGNVGIVMLNMGGPSSLDGPEDGVEFFLRNLFSDKDIIPLGPFQKHLGPIIAKRRAPMIKEQYKSIGGKSPIAEWTRIQGEMLEERLNKTAPLANGGRYKVYTGFRYAPPMTGAALEQMKADNVTRAVAFSQYPHFSCTTIGSSLNHLWRELDRLQLKDAFKWSVIDRWPLHKGFLNSVAKNVATTLKKIPKEEWNSAAIVFSSHSVPMKTVQKGDPYVQEVAASVSGVMELLRSGQVLPDATENDPNPEPIGRINIPYILSWQSKVGFLPWMQPSTLETLKGLGKQTKVKHVVIVPIAFTSDHVETLFELDQEVREEIFEDPNTSIQTLTITPGLNNSAVFADALTDIVKSHLDENVAHASPQYPFPCANCVNPECRNIANPIVPYSDLKRQ